MTRFVRFSEEELQVLHESLVMDDGITYGIEDDDQPTASLVDEMHAEADERGIDLRHRSGTR